MPAIPIIAALAPLAINAAIKATSADGHNSFKPTGFAGDGPRSQSATPVNPTQRLQSDMTKARGPMGAPAMPMSAATPAPITAMGQQPGVTPVGGR